LLLFYICYGLRRKTGLADGPLRWLLRLLLSLSLMLPRYTAAQLEELLQNQAAFKAVLQEAIKGSPVRACVGNPVDWT